MAVGGRGGLKQASLFQMTIPGLPIVYYGSEQGFVDQRPSMFAGGAGSGGTDHFDTESELYHHYQAVTELRKSDPIFTEGSVGILADNDAGPGVFAYERELDGETVIIIFNTSDRPVLLNGLETGLPAGAVLESLLALVSEPETLVAGAGGKLTMELPGREGLVLRATGETEEVAEVEGTITIDNRFEDQILSEPFAVGGLASEANTPVKLVINDNLANALETTAGDDGRWSVTVSLDSFPPGQSTNSMFAYAPELPAASEHVPFVVEVGDTSARVVVFDELGDDVGPFHLYTLPTDETTPPVTNTYFGITGLS